MNTISPNLINNTETLLVQDFSRKKSFKSNARVALTDQIVTRRCILDMTPEIKPKLLTVPVIKITFYSKVTRGGSRGVLISKNHSAYVLKFFRKNVKTIGDISLDDKVWAYVYGKNLIQLYWSEVFGKFDPLNAVPGTIQVPSPHTGKVRVKPQEVGGKSNQPTAYARCHCLDFGDDSLLWVDDNFLAPWNAMDNSFSTITEELLLSKPEPLVKTSTTLPSFSEFILMSK